MGAAGRPPNPVDKDLREIDRQIREVLLLERTIRVERLQGELISRTDVDDQRSRQVAAIRSRLFMIARRMRRALINATEQEIEDRLTEEFRAICADFAAGLEVPVDGNVAAAPAAAKQPAADVD
jgi:hypothetical protein